MRKVPQVIEWWGYVVFSYAERSSPQGESDLSESKPAPGDASASLVVDTPEGRFRARFTPDLPVSSLGALVFFAQYLAETGATANARVMLITLSDQRLPQPPITLHRP